MSTASPIAASPVAASPTLADSVALFDRSASAMIATLASVTVADLNRPTPCAGWDLRTLVQHIADVADAFAAMTVTGQFELTPTAHHDADLVAAADHRLRLLGDVLAAAAGCNGADGDANAILNATNTAQAGAIEYATHAWDVARACAGENAATMGGLPPAVAAEVLTLATSLIHDDSRPPVFAARIDVDASAPAGDRLAAFLGRNPQRTP